MCYFGLCTFLWLETGDFLVYFTKKLKIVIRISSIILVYICKFMIVICFNSNNIPSTGIYKGCTFPSISLRTSPLDFTIFQMNSWWVYVTKIILQYSNASTPEVNVVKFCKLPKTSCKIRGVWMINLKLLATFEKPNLVALLHSFTSRMTEHCTKTN